MAVIVIPGKFSFVERFDISEAFSKRMVTIIFIYLFREKQNMFEEESSKRMKWNSLAFLEIILRLIFLCLA